MEIKKFMKETLIDIAGAICIGFALLVFSAPNGIPFGGVGAISMILNHLTGVQIGTINFLINVPLIISAFFFLNKEIAIRTLRNIIVVTIVLNFGISHVPPFKGDLIIAAIAGGVCLGTGVGILFRSGATSGGVDIIVKIINKHNPHLQLGHIMRFIDASIALCSVFVFHNIQVALYGFIGIFVCSVCIDKIVYGGQQAKLMYIISPKKDEICKALTEDLDQSVTIINATGGYSNASQDVLMCGVSRQRFNPLKQKVFEIDPNAFITIVSADEMVSNRM